MTLNLKTNKEILCFTKNFSARALWRTWSTMWVQQTEPICLYYYYIRQARLKITIFSHLLKTRTLKSIAKVTLFQRKKLLRTAVKYSMDCIIWRQQDILIIICMLATSSSMEISLGKQIQKISNPIQTHFYSNRLYIDFSKKNTIK